MSIKWLQDCRKEDVVTVGGKAANLGELMNAGFIVPDGFVVLEDGITENLLKWEWEIEEAYEKLGRGKVAVRSSALAEDGDTASFAGQYDTFLNQEGDDKIINAIINCFMSLDNENAKEYAKSNGISENKMAVIVQRMVPADYAGVMFTKEPVTNDENIICIETVKGTGDALVSGYVTPESVLIDKGTLKITQTTLPRITNDTTLRKCAYIAKAIEQHYGKPQDIEFSIHDGIIWVCQSRPITT